MKKKVRFAGTFEAFRVEQDPNLDLASMDDLLRFRLGSTAYVGSTLRSPTYLPSTLASASLVIEFDLGLESLADSTWI